jgi:hypothetical protein
MLRAKRHWPSLKVCRVVLLVGASGLLLGAMLSPAWGAGAIVDSAGFESPTYSVGALQGQQSWTTAGGHAGTATVESSIAAPSSVQAVQVNRGANSDDYWLVHKVGYPTQRYVAIDWDMRVNQSFSSAFGPFFGVRSFDDHGLVIPGVLGTLGVDATTGDILYETGTQFTETGTLATFNAWHHYRVVFDFTAQEYQGFYDGTHLITAAFTDLGLGVNDFTDADIAALAAAGDSTSEAALGTAYFDNFVVRDGLLGDYDINGTVNTADYTAWKQAFGSTVATAGNGADGNANGKVDAADYTVWRDHLGASLFTGSGSGALSGSVVPEPSTLAQALFGVAMLGCLVRQRFGLTM